MFYLAYHLHWSSESILALDLGERRAFVQMLARRIEADNVALDAVGRRLAAR